MQNKFFQGEDTITANVVNTDVQSLITRMISSAIWEEVVPGMGDITVKFDPEKLSIEDACRHLEKHLDDSKCCIETAHAPSPIQLTVSLDAAYAPDKALVCEALGIAVGEFAEWLLTRRYHVNMMGFQPGFAYLEDDTGADLPVIPRLDRPRQRVAAGSIGFLGQKACIYALDGPGGWPIVGKVGKKLFDPANRDSPTLLMPGQQVQFVHDD